MNKEIYNKHKITTVDLCLFFNMKNFSKDLLDWYNVNKRPFPWRENINVYHTWICEIMSQQTILSVVLPRYKEFIKELPNLKSLAFCEDERLRKLWAGLGYYARARNLRKGAQFIIDEFQGTFPTNYSSWIKVPGCGPYTASVIASICFNEPVACVDGNVVRVVSRLLNLQANVWDKQGQDYIHRYVNQLIPIESPGDFNQAMMDLGATVCKKQNPTCEICPVKHYCQAFNKETVSLCPPVKPRKNSQEENIVAVIFKKISSDEVLLIMREQGFLAKTIGFPLISSNENLKIQISLDAIKKMGFSFTKLTGEFKHSITHHKIVGTAILVNDFNFNSKTEKIFQKQFKFSELQWIPFSQLKHNLSSSLDLKVLKILSSI
ncbi:A/G-specific adenine glycosylase [Pigmentibacter sp. JX0631]|uniref:A/G-specific adenine glycosylase n=1 Tax=Pigmentibacter sp. JX0631 TaxID=2976982 RepID=UPI00246937DB|nr:A/G-specific adenine glycosylase [Pigmentibacter sp. JX0631]WGL59547.1 A/G-specific adenine glycosylase [Pigmentibacter sp. JX0631]